MSETYRDENCLEHMAEACRKIRKIADVARADYAGVDPDVIWDSAQTDIPRLLAELEALGVGARS